MPDYIVGIDLGTTHTVVAFAPFDANEGGGAIRVLDVEQLVAPGEVVARPLLPSLRYHAAEGEFVEHDLMLPWGPADAGAVVGELARLRGAQVPGRLVASAKSWLSHAAVDRLAPILPWGAPAEVPKVSPVAASASYLAHVMAAWNHRHPQARLERQELVLTVPASFDDAARELTLQAARDAGLTSLRLLEEPQAAMYDWLFRHRGSLRADLADVSTVLICDVGGGTTDLSLVRVAMRDAGPELERFAVGRHLMLGGDNMDLALAQIAEARLAADGTSGTPARLAAGALSQLVERCRIAKERLLAADAPARAAITVLGAGSRLVGGARSTELHRDEVERIVLDGFFPNRAPDERPSRARTGAGLVAFGLPYASDPAVTRHVAAFLHEHAHAGWPDALLLNGGVFRSGAIVDRLQSTLTGWRGGVPLKILDNRDPDVAVARGAVAYALSRRGLAPRIGGGSPRSYFLLLDARHDAVQRAVCVLPRGSEEGHEVRLEGRTFALTSGEPVRFHVVASTHGSPTAGALADVAELDAQALPPLATVLRDGGAGRNEIPVCMISTLTEVGTLALNCIAVDDPTRRWKLEFQLRGDSDAIPSGALPSRFDEALAAIEGVFGARDRQAHPKAAKRLRAQLEALLGPRERWSLALLRPLHDALMQRARGRRRSAEHERLWYSLAGWCLRPGFGDPLDHWRIEQLWPLFEKGVQHGNDTQVCSEWWTLWRRVAGGLDEAAQQRLLQDFAFNLRGSELGEAAQAQRPPRLVKGSWDDMVRLAGGLEQIEPDHKVEIGVWLVQQLKRSIAHRPWTLWALGRLGARVPLYGSVHRVVPADQAAAWVEALLAFDWKQLDGAAAAAVSLARMSGDRTRDLPPEVRLRVLAALAATRAPASWTAVVREAVPLDEAARTSAFGEALPLGLKLLD